MKDEKFISIEYDKWEEFYKPLEESYKKLEEDLENTKKSRRADIHIHFNSKAIRGFDDMQIGFIEMSTEGPLLVDIPARKQLTEMLIEDIHASLKEKRKSNSSEYMYTPQYFNQFLKGSVLLTEEEIDKATCEIIEEREELEKEIIAHKESIKRFKEARKTLPWIVRKVFGIK